LKRRKNLGFLAAYDGLSLPRRICIEKTGEKLVEKLRITHAQGGISQPSKIVIITAPTRELLFDPEWERQKGHAIFIAREAVLEAVRRGDSVFLEAIEEAAKPAVRRGRPPTMEARHRIVDDLQEHLNKRKTLKELQTGKHVESGRHSLSARFSELYRDAYHTWFYMQQPNLAKLSEPMKDRFRRLGFRLPRQAKILEEVIQEGQNRFQNKPLPPRWSLS